MQRAVVGARLKAGRGGSLHGSSTQAGRKWPCAKAGSGCCQTGRGGWAVVGGGEEPRVQAALWLLEGGVSQGRSCLCGKSASWCVTTLGHLARSYFYHCGPTQSSCLALLGLGMLSSQDTLAVGKRCFSNHYLFSKHHYYRWGGVLCLSPAMGEPWR